MSKSLVLLSLKPCLFTIGYFLQVCKFGLCPVFGANRCILCVFSTSHGQFRVFPDFRDTVRDPGVASCPIISADMATIHFASSCQTCQKYRELEPFEREIIACPLSWDLKDPRLHGRGVGSCQQRHSHSQARGAPCEGAAKRLSLEQVWCRF